MVELTTDLLVELGGWPALKEARGLVERGKVTDVQRDGPRVSGRVQGAEKTYEPRIVLGDRVAEVEVRCTCPDSRRSGRVCAHALAVGLAAMSPPRVSEPPAAKATVATPAPQAVTVAGPRRWRDAEAPPGVPPCAFSFLFPLQLSEALARDPVRIILEVERDGAPQPWDAAIKGLAGGYAVAEEDDRALAALEGATGALAGVSLVPRARLAALLRALSGHPRLWLGRRERLQIAAAPERPALRVALREDGALELALGEPAPAFSAPTPLPGWQVEGTTLRELKAIPPGLDSQGRRIVSRAAIPDFLAREWPALEAAGEVVLPPRFVIAAAAPEIVAKLEGSLAGLTLELEARYPGHTFPVGWKADAESGAMFPDPHDLHRFWRRDLAVEKQAAIAVQADGFSPALRGGRGFGLAGERQVARFLANALPRWRREWGVEVGPRLAATLREVDIAEPSFELRGAPGEDWLGLDLRLSVAGSPVAIEAAKVQRWLQTGQSHARTPGRRVLLLPTEAWGEMQEVLADCEARQEPGRMRVRRTFAPYLAGALEAQGFRAGRNDATEVPPPEVAARLDPALVARMRPYQLAGTAWMAALAQRDAHGLLADDMGLGKTVQTLAFCAWLRTAGPAPALVVCPTSLVQNWLREAARFTPHLRTLDLTGPGRAARYADVPQADLVVTSYAILRRDLEPLRALDFGLVVLDEAQHIKNRGSQNAQAARMLRARHRLILTGTPLENSVLDLWSLFEFLLPGYLGTAADFRERYEAPLARAADTTGTPKVMARLRRRVRPFFLRRTKEEVLPELPPRLEHPTFCELSDEQREVYRAVLDQGRRDVFEHSGKAGAGRAQIAMLTTLLRLRQVCCHLDLLPAADGALPRAWREPSSKLDRAFELIDEAIDGGHRVLLFSQFVQMLHLLRDEARRREVAFCYLDGQTADRQGEVDRFQADAGVPLFLVSLKAGGTGLNLTGADTVIHFDPWWNPAVEDQATSRAHRLGQQRAVQSYKLIAAGTVEEKIQAMQTRKRGLFAASLGDEAFIAGLSADEMEELLSG